MIVEGFEWDYCTDCGWVGEHECPGPQMLPEHLVMACPRDTPEEEA